MAYSEEIIIQGEQRLRKKQRAHAEQRARLRQEIARQLPKAIELDRRLAQTAPRILAASLRQDSDSRTILEALRRENLALQEEQAALLVQAGYESTALDDVPLCPLCQDRGWRGAAMCSCLQQLCQQAQTESLSSLLDLRGQSFASFRLDYYDREIWPDYRRSPRENMEVILTTCRNYATPFGAYSHKNLFLTGDPGLGKTFLSACIAQVVSEQGFSVVYDSAPSIFDRFETRKFARSEESARQAQADARRYLVCDLLILDDLGSEFTSPYIQSALYEIVNTRLIENRHTVISSNLNLATIRQRYSPQIASRMEGEYLSLPFFGKDIRVVRRTRG